MVDLVEASGEEGLAAVVVDLEAVEAVITCEGEDDGVCSTTGWQNAVNCCHVGSGMFDVSHDAFSSQP